MGFFDFFRHKTDDQIEADELRRRNKTAPVTPAAPASDIYYNVPEEVTQNIKAMLLQGRKIEAIKYLKDNVSMGLKEAKDYVEGLTIEDEEKVTREPGLNNLDAETVDEARELLRQGHKMEAIKFIREESGISLKEAKEFVESL